jgi:hypothetical protein
MLPFCLNKVHDSTYPNRFPDPFISSSTCTSTKTYHFRREIVKKDGRIVLCNLTKMMTATRRFTVQPQHRLAANMTQEGKKNQEETAKRSKAHGNNKTFPVKSRQAVSCAFLHLHMTTKKHTPFAGIILIRF